MIDISYGNIEDPNFPKLFPDTIFNKRNSDVDKKLKE